MKTKKLIAWLLPLCIIFTMLPMTAFAAGSIRHEGVPTNDGDWYEYEILTNCTDSPHYLNVSNMADDGYELFSVLPCFEENLANIDADKHTDANTVEITFGKKPNASREYNLTFTKDGFKSVVKQLSIRIVKLERNLELRENNSKVNELNINKGNSRTLTLHDSDGQILAGEFADYTFINNNEKVATVRVDGDNLIIDTKAIGTATISVEIAENDLYNYDVVFLDIVVTDAVPEDGSKDVVISFEHTYDSYDTIKVGGVAVVISGSDGTGTLTGYKDYVESIGKYEEGSTNVTLYADFIKYLQSENVTTIDVEYVNGEDERILTIPVKIRALQDYTVSFEPGEGTGTMEDVILSEKPGEIGVDYKLPQSTFTAPYGKEFDTWFVKDAQTGEITTYAVESTEKITGNITFTAQWKALPTYNVSYEDGVTSATITVPTDVKAYLANEEVTVSTTALTRDGYKFKGWKDQTDSPVTITDGKFDMPARDVVLVAQWEEIPALDVPTTGDNSNLMLYIVLALVSLSGAGMAIYKRKITK